MLRDCEAMELLCMAVKLTSSGVTCRELVPTVRPQVLARDVAYELIPYSQRRLLHALLARALEEDGRAGRVVASILAYHWTHSCAGVEATEWRRALQVWRSLPSRESYTGTLLQSAFPSGTTKTRLSCSRPQPCFMREQV